VKKYSREDWLDFGLETLREQGYASLKALSLARAMGVTRGSFYHYFESIEVYNEALIEHWTAQSTEVLIDDLKTIINPEAVLLESDLGANSVSNQEIAGLTKMIIKP